jgi:ATP-dependent RNA helicase DOB1
VTTRLAPPPPAPPIRAAGEEGSLLPPAPRPGPPARVYPFPIDPFQQAAINALEAGHSVLVAAHTSAGKTVVAEYAMAMALRDGARVVYTSPLKALSNQKFREFQAEFGDVGLMTGDVVINPSASCLVMTTEILRSMLYRGSEVVREASLIVYDEIHYLRDAERGVVWEESIALAPPAARFAFLSATIPNAREFAEWVAATHRGPCHVVYTDYRPTPLEHYLFPAGAEGLFLVVEGGGAFREDNFSRAVAALSDADAAAAAAKGARRRGGGGGQSGGPKDASVGADAKSDISRLVKMIVDRRFDPAIVFSFSKVECEALAGEMGGLELNDASERGGVGAVFAGAVEVLSEADRRLPQVTALLPQLQRGVGVHHSGMLPILKEVTEVLFQEGLIKVLFATETFSTGLNMPAKTVVFTHARKFDGGAFRWLTSGEYTQMSGRAGRRGLDDKGVVVLMLDAKMDPPTARDMLRGAPDPLHSAFHLTYSMLLNMLRVEGAAPEALMRRSYRQFQAQRALPQLEARAAALEARRDAVAVEGEAAVAEVAALRAQAAGLRAERRALVVCPRHALPYLQPGRLVRVLPPGAAPGDPGVWAAVVNFERAGKQPPPPPGGEQDEEGAAAGGGGAGGKQAKAEAAYVVDVLCVCAAPAGAEEAGAAAGRRRAVPVDPSAAGGLPAVVPVSLEEVAALSSVRVHIPKDLRTAEARAAGGRLLGEVARRFAGAGGPPLLDPEDDMKIGDERLRGVRRRLESVEAMLERHPLARSPSLPARLEALEAKRALGAAAKEVRREAKAAQGLVLQADLKSRRRVLRRLGFVDGEGLVSKKGRAAAEITTGDELVLCELAFGGALGALRPDQLAALVSCFVWREKAEAAGRVPPEMEAAVAALREAARRVGRAEAECGMPADVDEYVASFKPELMEVVLAWCGGATFAHIMKLAGKVFEGSLVRAFRRLDELLRQLAAALRAVGDVELAARVEEAIEKIKRDVIFAASLFL